MTHTPKPDAHFERLAISRYEEIKKLRELLREMGECLEYEVEILGFDAACARDALKKYREMTK